ncbi:hypothetical protein [Desulfocurvus sp. DL9XJH121]
MPRKRDPKKMADAFVKEYKALIEKYYGNLEVPEFEPFGMRLRELLPLLRDDCDQITTTATISIPWDTDPPDRDC